MMSRAKSHKTTMCAARNNPYDIIDTDNIVHRRCMIRRKEL